MKRLFKWHHLILFAILILAAGLRFYKLDALPPPLYNDEAYNGLDAFALLEGRTFPIFHEGWEAHGDTVFEDRPITPRRFPIFFEGNYGREPVHIYLMALSGWLFGQTPFAVRAVPAFAGVLSVLTVYWGAQAFSPSSWSRRSRNHENSNHPLRLNVAIPLVAAFVMAVLFPAVHFSRFGLRLMVFVPVEVLCITCFWHGISHWGNQNKRSMLFFALSGFLLGLGLYIYLVGRLLPFLFVLFVPIWFLIDSTAFKKFWKPLAVMVAAAVLTVTPLLIYFWRYPFFLFFRTGYVADTGADVTDAGAVANVWRVIWGLFVSGDQNIRQNLPGRPFMNPIFSLFFGVGLFAKVKTSLSIGSNPSAKGQEQTDQLKSIFLFLWFLLMLLPSILSSEAPHFSRLSSVTPVVAIMIALGVGYVWDWLAQQQFQFTSPNYLMQTGLFLILGISGFIPIWAYFVTYASDPRLNQAFHQDFWETAQAIDTYSDDYLFYLTPPQQKLATFYLSLGENQHKLTNYDGAQSLVPMSIPGEGAVFIVQKDDQASLQNLSAFYLGAHLDDSLQSYTLLIVDEPT
ncbi:MAG: hypothetical protein AAGD96_27815, partial [Chloroflexota bacterium]